MAKRDTTQTSTRYAHIDVHRDETIIYDREHPTAWIQGYGHPIRDMR